MATRAAAPSAQSSRNSRLVFRVYSDQMSFSETGSIIVNSVITSIAVSANSDYFALGSLDQLALVYEARFNNKIQKEFYRFEGHSLGVIDLAFNRSGTRMVVSCLDSCLRLWNIDDGTLLSKMQCQPMEAWKVCFLEENIAVSGEMAKINLYSTTSYEKYADKRMEEGFSTAITSSPDARFLAGANKSGSVFIFDSSLKSKEHSYKPHHRMVRDLCFTPDSQKLFSCSDDASVVYFDLNVNKPIATFKGHSDSVHSLSVNPVDARHFATGGSDKSVRYWDVNTKKTVAVISNHTANVWSVRHSFDGKHLLSGGQSGILLIHSQK